MQYQETKEPKVRIEYTIPKDNQTIKVNAVAIDNDNALCSHVEKGINTSSRRYLNESITSPSRNMILAQHFYEIKNVYQALNFQNPQIFLTAFNIIQLCVIKNISDIKISKSGENELLLYRNKNGEFSNILIDEDCDVSYMFIGKKPGTERTEYFPKEKGLDYSKFASLL